MSGAESDSPVAQWRMKSAGLCHQDPEYASVPPLLLCKEKKYIHLNTKESERDNTKREGERGNIRGTLSLNSPLLIYHLLLSPLNKKY